MSVTEEAVNTPEVESAGTAKPKVAKVDAGSKTPPALGDAEQVDLPASSQLADGASRHAVSATGVQAPADSGGLPWPALILCGLVLLYAGARLLLGPVEPDFLRSSRFRFVRRAFPRA